MYHETKAKQLYSTKDDVNINNMKDEGNCQPRISRYQTTNSAELGGDVKVIQGGVEVVIDTWALPGRSSETSTAH